MTAAIGAIEEWHAREKGLTSVDFMDEEWAKNMSTPKPFLSLIFSFISRETKPGFFVSTAESTWGGSARRVKPEGSCER